MLINKIFVIVIHIEYLHDIIVFNTEYLIINIKY